MYSSQIILIPYSLKSASLGVQLHCKSGGKNVHSKNKGEGEEPVIAWVQLTWVSQWSHPRGAHLPKAAEVISDHQNNACAFPCSQPHYHLG